MTETKLVLQTEDKGPRPNFDSMEIGDVFLSYALSREQMFILHEDENSHRVGICLHPEDYSGVAFEEKELSGYRPVTTITYTVEA